MDTIQYRGAYRFEDRAALDHAVSAALDDKPEWQPHFRAHASALRIDVSLDLPQSQADDRRAAARVMQTLAYLAVEGIVVARDRARSIAVDVFVCGE